MKTTSNKAGIYITVIFHLAVIIVLLLAGVDSALRREESFVLDFSKQEKIEKEQKEIEFKEDISRKLDELISMAKQQNPQNIRNIAVDANAPLKDDRNTDAEQLYKDAERIAKDLKSNAIEEDARGETVEMQHQRKDDDKKKTYSGPSLVTYNLEGRKASYLHTPSYKCMGSGDVCVIITVDQGGKVVNAKVQEEMSSDDKCLRNYAVRSARLSRFSAPKNAPARQQGDILYRFIAQ
ncbi:MAG: energy transducer TonB [Candidatus Cryptobacteroides sp.]